MPPLFHFVEDAKAETNRKLAHHPTHEQSAEPVPAIDGAPRHVSYAPMAGGTVASGLIETDFPVLVSFVNSTKANTDGVVHTLQIPNAKECRLVHMIPLSRSLRLETISKISKQSFVSLGYGSPKEAKPRAQSLAEKLPLPNNSKQAIIETESSIQPAVDEFDRLMQHRPTDVSAFSVVDGIPMRKTARRSLRPRSYSDTAYGAEASRKHEDMEFAATRMDDKEPLEPTNQELLEAWHIATILYPRVYDTTRIDQPMLSRFCDHLRSRRKFKVSSRRIYRLFLPHFTTLSMGSIPINDKDIAEEDALQAREVNIATLLRECVEPEPEPDDKEDDELKRWWAAPTRVAVVQEALGEPVVRTEEVKALLKLIRHSEFKSSVRLKLDMSHLKSDTPHRAEVHLTERNQREDDLQDTDFIPTHLTVDVTAPANFPALTALFPHKDLKYFVDLYHSLDKGMQLVLMFLQHNSYHCTSNVFNTGEAVSPTHEGLRATIRDSPLICVLMCTVKQNLDSRMDNIVQEWTKLAHYDPTTAFLHDPEDSAILDAEAFKPVKQTPRYTVPADYVFETYLDYHRRVALAVFMEHDYMDVTTAYHGRAIFVPVPNTDARDGLPATYYAYVTLDEEAVRLPRLQPGDRITMAFGVDLDIVPADAWAGNVVEPNIISGMAKITLLIKRPSNKDTRDWADDRDHSSITLRRLAKLQPDQVIAAFAHLKAPEVSLFPHRDGKEGSRLLKGLGALQLSYTMREKDPMKQQMTQPTRDMLVATNPSALPKSGLYDSLSDPDAALALAAEDMRDDQVEGLTRLSQDGLRAKCGFIVGLSGSGKTYFAMRSLVPFIGAKVHVLKHVFDRTEHEYTTISKNDDLEGVFEVEEGQFATSSDTTVEECARLMFVAAQNNTADDMHVKAKAMYTRHNTRMGKRPPLCIRFYSRDTENRLVQALADPKFDDGPIASPYISSDKDIEGDIAASLFRTFKKQTTSTYRHINDERVKFPKDSAAWYALQMLGIRPRSPELLAKMSTEHINTWAKSGEAKAAKNAVTQYIKDGKWTKDTVQQLMKASKSARLEITRAADVSTGTLAGADNGYQYGVRHPHFILAEEMSRVNAASFATLMARYWMSMVVEFVGDVKQLPPTAFGDKRVNNFQAQLKLSDLNRLILTGLEPVEFKVTSRFTNEEILKIARIVNGLDYLEMVPGAGRSASRACEMHQKLYRISKAAVFVNVIGANPRKDATGSSFCRESAIVAMRDVEQSLSVIQADESMALLTPYVAQVTLLRLMMDSLIREMDKRNTTRQFVAVLKRIVISTIDGFQGQEADYIGLDTCCCNGHLNDPARLDVGFTRARKGYTAYGDTKLIIRKGGLLFAQLVREMTSDGQLYQMAAEELAGLPQYPQATV